jgi:hypothetical protein
LYEVSMSSRTRRIVSSASMAAVIVAAAALVGLPPVSIYGGRGEPWGTVSHLSGVVMTLALAPTMLAYYELGGRTPTPLAQAAQVSGWLAVIAWCVLHALFIGGAVAFDYDTPATGAMALEQVALVVIGLWIAGANLLAAEWLNWVRWLGVVTGIGFVSLGAGLLLGGASHPFSYAGAIGFVLVLPVWAFLVARLLGRIAAERQASVA